MNRNQTLNLYEAFDRLQAGGKLRHYEVHELKSRLKKPALSDDIGMLAQVFTMGVKAYSGNVNLVQRYLDKSMDPYDLAGVIRGICNNWHHAARHKTFLLSVCHHRNYFRLFEAANAAFEVFEKNIERTIFVDTFESLFWRWQEVLNADEDHHYEAGYTRGLNRVMEVALLGDKIHEPFHTRAGQFLNAEWEEPLQEKIIELKARAADARRKMGFFARFFREKEMA